MNPLHIACDKGNKTIVNLLIDLDGDINSKDINNYTPLHHAVMSRNEKLVKFLLLRGANKFMKDWKNRTPYDLALSMKEKKLINLLHHHNCCMRNIFGREIGPLTKTNNHCYLLCLLLYSTVFLNRFLPLILLNFENFHHF